MRRKKNSVEEYTHQNDEKSCLNSLKEKTSPFYSDADRSAVGIEIMYSILAAGNKGPMKDVFEVPTVPF